ncbi:MAG: Trk system potassium transporter TrkA, partial [Nitrospinota bacterium]|nr:Trk system potassium transporter TrkA [Nitrospinota bacterium]
LLAKRIGVRKVVVVTDETTYLPVLDSIGLDVVVNPHNLTAGRILTAMRKGMVRSVVMLRAGVADLLEFVVDPGSRMDGKRLQGAGFPKGAIVGMVIREEDLIIPDGSTVFQANDKVIVVTLRDKIETVEKLFSSGGLL